MKVVHIVKTLSGTSIPVELASQLNSVRDLRSDIISLTRSDDLPDIVDPNHVVMNGTASTESVIDFITTGRYDLVNTHHNAGSAESRRISRMLHRARVPIVDSQHGRIHYSLRQLYWNAIGMAVSSGVTFNSACTEESYTWFERLLIRRKPRRVIHLGVNTDVLAKYRTPSTGVIKRISCAARLIARKNHATVLRALQHIEGASVELDVIGGGPLHEALATEARRLGITDRVTFHGALRDREQVYEILARSDLFVLPSLGEGFCVAVAEAMAIGLPVIVSDIDTFREVLGDGGLYVPAKDSHALAGQIMQLIHAPERARQLGAANRERALALFAMAGTVGQFRDFYHHVLSRVPGRVTNLAGV